jgi:predicted transcriptional regulator
LLKVESLLFASMVGSTIQQSISKEKRPIAGKRISIDSVLYVLKMSCEPQGATLNKLARKRYGNYRSASTVINRLVLYGMVDEQITRDERHVPRVSFTITEKGRAALRLFEEW